jgi:diguanylate cyclase (GGDEF)-like protein/PAS domain S-box-containing protein
MAQSQLKKNEEQYRLIVDMANESIVVEQDGMLKFVNLKAQQMTGYSAEELTSRPFVDFIYEDDKAMMKANYIKRINGEPLPERHTLRIVAKDGSVRWCEMSGARTERDGHLATFNFITDITERKQAEDEIHLLAFFDPLTHLPNRRLLMDRLNSVLATSERSQLYGAVLFLDMDRFKTLNDTLGHDFGDLLLIEVAKRTQTCVRAVDTTARLGGDEFVVVLEEIDKNPEEAAYKIAFIAEKIRISLSSPYQLNQHIQHSSPSIGVCLFRGHEDSADTLLKHADMAMYQVKESGRNAVRFFDPAMQLEVETHAALETDLRTALSNRQLQLHYQIQVNAEHIPIGAEALLRWEHPERGMIPPSVFIPIAEESSLILDIGNWVMETAIIQLGLWAKREDAKNLTLAVNVSANQFKQDDFVEQISSLLHTHHVGASRLKLELTESVVLSDLNDVVIKMQALKAIGVCLSLDDFGTGYSSLSYLKRLPLDQIKIDQSFVRDIATDANDAVMVQTIIDLARNFRLNVIAEGVETEAQRLFLAKHGCLAYQGYLFGKPGPIESFEAALQQR